MVSITVAASVVLFWKTLKLIGITFLRCSKFERTFSTT
jgi:hypothetical protein